MQNTLVTKTWQCRTAPTLGSGFAGTPNKVWGTKNYKNDEDPTVFFGLYGLPDFYALWRHKGQKAILWAGSDITHFKKGYWLDDKGRIRLDPKALASWIQENCESYVENEVERTELLQHGITSTVIPSFLGDIDKFPVVYKYKPKAQFYTSVSGDDFTLYGWDKIEDLSDDYPNVEFHLYGNIQPWYTDKPNIFVHGRVSQSQMNKDIKGMTGALRLTEHDGMSEILVKSVLWGQWPVSPYIPYPHICGSIAEATGHKEPNYSGRNYYERVLNDYPFNAKNN